MVKGRAFLYLRRTSVLTGSIPETPWSFLAWGPWGPQSPCPSLWILLWCPHHRSLGSSSPLGQRAWMQLLPPLPRALPAQQQPWPITETLRLTDIPQVTAQFFWLHAIGATIVTLSVATSHQEATLKMARFLHRAMPITFPKPGEMIFMHPDL